MHEKLRVALDAANTSREVYGAGCLAVWYELRAANPELTDAILETGLDEPAAAQWVCQLGKDGDSLAGWVVAGRSADALSAVRRAMHGFLG
jgi:hypothetical protein